MSAQRRNNTDYDVLLLSDVVEVNQHLDPCCLWSEGIRLQSATIAALESSADSFNTRNVMKIERAIAEDVPAIARAQVRSWQAAYERIVPPLRVPSLTPTGGSLADRSVAVRSPADQLATLSVEKREALWRELLARGAPELLVAKDHEYIVGFVAFGRCRDDDAIASRAEIWSMYVIPSHWSQGVGTQLWNQARERMSELGYRTVSLWLLAANTRAIQFYDRMGFDLDEDTAAKEVVIGGQALSEVRYIARVR